MLPGNRELRDARKYPRTELREAMSLVPDDELAKLVREEPAGARDRKEEAPGVDHPAPKTAPDENELRLREAAALRSQVANYEAALRAIDAAEELLNESKNSACDVQPVF